MDVNFTLRACPICRKKAKLREAGNTSFLTYSLLYGENYFGSRRNYLKLDFAPSFEQVVEHRLGHLPSTEKQVVTPTVS
ncbi:hypothetical protein LOK49_Contig100G00005 [Camellia lanceoleosa]|nr:hypothetical protein LOK49_Contig100G00005 [Camellia lanceoleosa]